MATLAERLALPDMVGVPDWQAAEMLNTPDPTLGFVRLDLDPMDIYETMLSTGEWGRVELFSRLTPSGTLATPSGDDNVVARLVTFVRTAQFTRSIRTSRAAIANVFVQLMDGLVIDGFMLASTRATILGLARRRQSWAEANGVLVTARTVGIARGAIA